MVRKKIPPLYGRQAQDYRTLAPAFQQVWQEDDARETSEHFKSTGHYLREHWTDECKRVHGVQEDGRQKCANLAWYQVVLSREP